MSQNNEAVDVLREILSKQTEQTEITALLSDMLAAQRETNVLIKATLQKQNQHAQQMVRWRHDNSELAERCGNCAQRAGDLMNNLVDSMVTDIENISGSPFELSELIDKYGTKCQQLNVIMQTLAHLGI